MLKFIKANQIYDLSLTGVRFYDVRSPGEFAESSVPGAESMPLLDDAERSEVGTLYKQVGADAALKRGLEILKPKVEEKIFSVIHDSLYVDDGDVRFKLNASFSKIDKNLTKIFYCWRGGARSKIMATIHGLQGYDVGIIEGGHKAWRNEILEFLNSPQYPFKLSTLYGFTGCGKTKILNQWAKEGRAVIDLEALAHHRGSAFGQIGIEQIGGQKIFEANLYWKMKEMQKRGVDKVYVEGESQRIGRCLLPDAFMKAMLDGEHIKVEKSLEERVEHIINEYIKPVPRHEWISQASRSLDVIKKRLGGEKHSELLKDLVSGDDAALVRKLLVDYYDKTYSLSKAPDSFYHQII